MFGRFCIVLFLVLFIQVGFTQNLPSSDEKIQNGVTAMLFPILGDAQCYFNIGEVFSESIKKTGVIDTLQHKPSSIRPWGIVLFLTVPFLVTSDPVLINYIFVFLNLFFASVSLLLLIGWMSRDKCSDASIKKIFFVAWLSLCFVPFIPIIMSDLISLTFFLIGIHFIYQLDIEYLFKKGSLSKRSMLMFFLSGLSFATAGLLKQNHLVHTILYLLAFIFVYRNIFFKKEHIKTSFQVMLYFLIGFSFCLTQIIYIYYQYGVFNIIGPGLEISSAVNYRPYVELIAYTLPHGAAYLTKLDSSVNIISFYFIKLYEGMTKLYLPIYHGIAPTDVIISVTPQYLMKVYGFFLSLCVITYGLYKKYSFRERVLLISSFLITLFIANFHTENRYYLYPRIIYGLFIIDFLVTFLQSLRAYEKNQSL